MAFVAGVTFAASAGITVFATGQAAFANFAFVGAAGAGCAFAVPAVAIAFFITLEIAATAFYAGAFGSRCRIDPHHVDVLASYVGDIEHEIDTSINSILKAF